MEVEIWDIGSLKAEVGMGVGVWGGGVKRRAPGVRRIRGDGTGEWERQGSSR